MSLPAALEALKEEALQVSCQSWAIQRRWPLSKGREMVGPCPACGGTDRFSINTQKNIFNCRKCGIAGEGAIKLVMLTEQVEFRRACEIITGRTASDPIDEARTERLRQENARAAAERDAVAARERQKARRAAADTWKAGQPLLDDGPVVAYLRLRALDFDGHPLVVNWRGLRLRQAFSLPWVETTKDDAGRPIYRKLHEGPAMLAEIVLPQRLVAPGDALRQFGGVHQTWIDPALVGGRSHDGSQLAGKGKLVLPPDEKGRARPVKKMRGAKSGGAIPLFTPAGARRIVMGEGIETTLTPLCHAAEPDTAYWAGGDVGNMAGRALREDGRQVHDVPDMADDDCFIAPDWCEELVFLGEADEPGAHQKGKCIRGLRRSAAWRQARIAEGAPLAPLSIKYVPPPEGGFSDLNDLAMSEVAMAGPEEDGRSGGEGGE